MNSGVMKGQVEHKYDYSAIQFDTPAYGWSSTKDKIGIWLINPSNEYMSGGATKLELIAHRDATFTDRLTAPAPATILNVWKGPHYGGTNADVEQGEEWKKTIGPFLLYCNTGETPEAAWKDALNRAAKEQSAWVYDWASDVEYPAKKDRGSVSGKIVLDIRNRIWATCSSASPTPITNLPTGKRSIGSMTESITSSGCAGSQTAGS